MSSPRIISLVLLALSSGLAVWSWTTPELTQTKIIGIYMALAMVGPILTLLDTLHPCAPRRWLHDGETVARLATLATLVLRLDDPNKWILMAIGIMHAIGLMACPGDRYTVNFNAVDRKASLLHLATLVLVSGLCIVWAHHQSIALASLFFLTGLLFWLGLVGLLLGNARLARWYCFDQPLTQEQHQDIWPLLIEQQPNRCWRDVVEHHTHHGGFAQALKGLPMPTLLALFNRHAHDIEREPHMEIMLKEAINEREPRARVFWQMYNSKEAATLIGQLAQETEGDAPDTLEIPAL